MDIRILDRAGQPLSADQIEQLNIWNETMEHICASALERVRKENVAVPISVAKESKV